MAIDIINNFAEDAAAVVDDANADFQSLVDGLGDSAEFSQLILAQGGAANLTATTSAMTGALQATTSAVSTAAGKVGS